MRCKRTDQSAVAVVCLMSPPANGRSVFTYVRLRRNNHLLHVPFLPRWRCPRIRWRMTWGWCWSRCRCWRRPRRWSWPRARWSSAGPGTPAASSGPLTHNTLHLNILHYFLFCPNLQRFPDTSMDKSINYLCRSTNSERMIVYLKRWPRRGKTPGSGRSHFPCSGSAMTMTMNAG